MVIGFIGLLQPVTTSNYNCYTDLHTLQVTKACAKSSQSAVSLPVVAWSRLPTL
jgi:hypothetical protein